MTNRWRLWLALACCGLVMGIPVLSQQTPSRINLRFWAFSGQAFAEGLKPGDLELAVDNRPWALDELQLYRAGSVVRREGGDLSRSPDGHDYILLFQVYEYNAGFERILSYFIQEVLRPNDALIVITPFHTFRVLPEQLKKADRKALAKGINQDFRRDVKSGSAIYRGMIRQLRAMIFNISRSGAGGVAVQDNADPEMDNSEPDMGIQVNILRYKEMLPQFEKLRLAEQGRMLSLAGILKNPRRFQTVFFIYQKEYRPEPEERVRNVILSTGIDVPTIQADIAEIFDFSRREARYDSARIARAFADSGAQFHLLFINQQPQAISGLVMRECSEDVLTTFSAVALATGGEVAHSSSSEKVFRQLVEKYAQFYCLTFMPDAMPGFHSLRLKPKDPALSVVCSSGYQGQGR